MESQRLPPQPAKLLNLLIEQKGQIVSHEEIRKRLWPDVTVEFEQGLHFCVRQIRSALGDTAKEPRYIETLPRRGYRLIANVAPIDGDEPSGAPGANSRPRSRRKVIPAAIAVVLALGVLWFSGSPQPRPIRLAIMPFNAPTDMTFDGDPAPIGELLIVRLTNANPPDVEIIGPTTTQAYAQNATTLRQLIDDMHIDYLLNPRFTDAGEGPFMLVELIRATDGAHIWTHRFTNFKSSASIAESITQNTIPRLISRSEEVSR